MRIESVNVGRAAKLLIRGKSVETGIFKSPVRGAVRIGPAGLEGDELVDSRKAGRAHHAVSVYAREHYDHWSRELDCGPFDAGHFGENLTTAGLLESDVRMGDVLRFGGATLQVAQPRIPCRKLSARVAPGFAGRFLRSLRTGFYLRVLQPGLVAPGDPIELLDRDETSPCVERFLRVAELDFWDAEGLEDLLRTRDLVPLWREKLEEKLERARAADGWFGLRELRVVERTHESPGVVSLRLACARGKPLAPFRPGQYLTIVLRPSPEQRPLRRAYAISSDADVLDSYRITVRRDRGRGDGAPAGVVSSHLHDRIAVGDKLRAGAPRGFFLLEAAATKPMLVFLAEGVGVAPVVSMLRHWAHRSARPNALLVHWTHPGEPHPLATDLERLCSAGLVVDRRDPSEPGAGSLRRALAPTDAHYFISGSSGFVRSIHGRLLDAGLREEQLTKEAFGMIEGVGALDAEPTDGE